MNKLTDFYHCLKTKKRIVIFGTGNAARRISACLPGKIDYYVDNNRDKWGLVFNGAMICNPEKLLSEPAQDLMIIVASMYDEEIIRQLAGMGFAENEHIWNGYHLFEIDTVQVKQKNHLKKLTLLDTKDQIYVAEYPKSGGSWLVSILGDLLKIPKRDIYVDNSFVNKEKYRNHFWYEGQVDWDRLPRSVIKSHEKPDSELHPANAKYIHMFRDGRDVIVSYYFFKTDYLVKNGLAPQVEINFADFVARIAAEWKNYVEAWRKLNVVTCRYEELNTDTVETVGRLITQIGYDKSVLDIQSAVLNNTKLKMREKMGGFNKYNTFVRKGIIGDWRNYFNDDHKKTFKKIGGHLLIELGYEKDNNW
jgi:hypothetical protein